MIADSHLASFSALGDPTRWMLLTKLADAPATATDLATGLPITRQAVARHLGILERAGLVRGERRSQAVVFVPIGAHLEDLARELAAVGMLWDRRLDRLKAAAEAAEVEPPDSAGGS